MTPIAHLFAVAVLAVAPLQAQQPPIAALQSRLAVKAPGPVFTLYSQPDGHLGCDLDELPDWEEVILYRPDGERDLEVLPGPPPDSLLSISLDLTGFTPEAEVAFQFAVAIWGAALDGTVPLRVAATYAPIDGPSGTVAFAGPDGLFRDFGAGLPDTFYAAALADQLVGFDLSPSGVDISATFDSSENWYLGVDGNPGGGQIDFITVVLHELGHGLGFIASDDVDGSGVGSYGFGSGNRPAIFDIFIEDGGGHLLTDETNPSQALGDFLTSGDVFFDGPEVVLVNGGPGQLYAPSPYRSGSSISHWDPGVFPPASANGVMGPSVQSGRANHNPGPLTLALFQDHGWALDSGGPSNQPPIASAGANQTVDEGDPVSLEGIGSVDPEGDSLTYSWTQLSGPSVSLSGAATSTASFSAPAVNQNTVLSFRLTVDDGQASDDDAVNVTVTDTNGRPTANAGPNQTVSPGQNVQLNGSASDPDGDPITVSWSQLGAPPDDIVTLAGGNTLTPTFTAPATPQSLTLRLTASDGSLSDSDNVTITVQSSGQPDLRPEGLSGWPGPLRLSNQADSLPEPQDFRDGDSLYVDWAVSNRGNASVDGIYRVQIFVDGQLNAAWDVSPSQAAGAFESRSNVLLGEFGEGTYSIQIVVDGPGQVQESNEGNNTFSRQLVVEKTSEEQNDGLPTLIFPHFVDGESGGFANGSRVILRNPSDEAETGMLRFVDFEGMPVVLLTSSGEGAQFPYLIAPWGTFELRTFGVGPLKTGVIQVISDLTTSAVVGTEVFSVLGNFVSIQSAVVRSTHEVYVSVDGSENTGIAIFNPGAEDVGIDVVLLDPGGLERASMVLLVDAGSQTLSFVNESALLQSFFDSLPPGIVFRGTLQLRVQNGHEVAVVGLIQKATGELLAVETTSLP